MDDKSPNQTQTNIDDLVKELSRPQGVPPKTQPPEPPKPVSSMPPKPVSSPVSPTAPVPPPQMPSKPVSSAPSVPKEFDSNIRTMTDDLGHLKSGQKLTGTDVPRTIPTPAPKPAPAPIIKPPQMPPKPANLPPPVMSAPKPAMPLPKAPHMPAVSVPKMSDIPSKQAVPAPKMPAAATPKPFAKAPQSPAIPSDNQNNQQLYTPQSGGGTNRNILFIAIAVVVVIFGVVYWFFFIRQPSTPEVATVSPTMTVTPTATPLSVMQTVFPNQAGNIVLPPSGNPASAFNTALSTQTVPVGTFGVLNVQNSIASGSAQTLDPFSLMDRFLISYPTNLKSEANISESAILAYGQQESFGPKGQVLSGQTVTPRLVIVSQVASSSADDLKAWEPNMTSDLSGLFNINPTKNTKPFQDSNYRGVPIRFKNFPYPDSSIDYAVMPYNGNYYMILAGSREAMFATIDAFNVPGK